MRDQPRRKTLVGWLMPSRAPRSDGGPRPPSKGLRARGRAGHRPRRRAKPSSAAAPTRGPRKPLAPRRAGLRPR
jgi:hypothetical protein